MLQKEIDRLQAVEMFLNLKSNKETELQQIVALAAEICETETAYITFIDEDTQHIKFKFGDGPERASSRHSFCKYVVKQNELMIVPDTRLDERFKDNPYVTGPGNIRFYAGSPLTTTDGYNLGSLCVMDQIPRELTHIQKRILDNLSKQVISLLEFESTLQLVNQQIEEAKNSEIKIRSFFESSSSFHVLIDEKYKIVAFNKLVEDFVTRIYGVVLTEGISVKPFIGRMYMKEFISNCCIALSGKSITHERFLIFNNDRRWWSLSYEPARDPAGEIVGISFNGTDITQRTLKEQEVIQQNEELKQIAYIQSHEIRSPLSTIVGFMQYFEAEDYQATQEELIMMKKAVDQLDKKIRKIVEFTAG